MTFEHNFQLRDLVSEIRTEPAPIRELQLITFAPQHAREEHR
jgi:hypothetical protein